MTKQIDPSSAPLQVFTLLMAKRLIMSTIDLGGGLDELKRKEMDTKELSLGVIIITEENAPSTIGKMPNGKKLTKPIAQQ
jgi:hypothetical protein